MRNYVELFGLGVDYTSPGPPPTRLHSNLGPYATFDDWMEQGKPQLDQILATCSNVVIDYWPSDNDSPRFYLLLSKDMIARCVPIGNSPGFQYTRAKSPRDDWSHGH